MELCTQCNQPESAHTRRIFGHSFKRPTEESNPNYASDLVDSLSDAGSVFSSDSTASNTGDSGGCDAGSDGGCDGGGGGGGE